MKLLVLRDKKPGHFNQAEGVARAIGRMAPIEVARLDIRPSWFAHDDIRKLIMRRWGRDPVYWLKAMYHVDPSMLEPPDAIIGSGRPTICAGIFLKRIFKVPFLYSGQIGGYDTREVDLQLVASPRSAGNPRSAWVLIPNIVDPDALPPARPLRTVEDLRGAEIALLVGGTAYRKEYPLNEWQGLARLVGEVAERYGVRWRVTTSRRTPDEAADLLAGLAAQGRIAEFIDFRRAGVGSAGDLFRADAIVVTEDSMSMLAEGLSARRPVIGLRSAVVQDGYANEAIAAMAAGPSLAILPLASVSAEQFARTLTGLTIPTTDARDRICAAVAPILGLSAPHAVQARQTAS
ncbi:mitochondrial fission ELM1 family protein [Ancylobacter sp. 6x-1]|uniref:Mitochondrial fission ELM1 family protein n=1 Tax=Ancylobacter crimeensis TaxID=2579147 RepID=A0ABT0D9Y8_9HYPH|nr:ELM1/GtrOC1 family putative glycosyltransferase [Ancylobacter crimeensis]MCK0196769.1 mitochondrial fission ELM1 family protein [Ancylobacter crimeensis]